MENITHQAIVVPNGQFNPNQAARRTSLFTPDGLSYGSRLLYESTISAWPLSGADGTPNKFASGINPNTDPFSRWRTITRPNETFGSGSAAYTSALMTNKNRISSELYFDDENAEGSCLFKPSTPGFLSIMFDVYIQAVTGPYEQKIRLGANVYSLDWSAISESTQHVVGVTNGIGGYGQVVANAYLDPEESEYFMFSAYVEQQSATVLTNAHVVANGGCVVTFTPSPKANIGPWFVPA
jgi:hypothetical protein